MEKVISTLKAIFKEDRRNTDHQIRKARRKEKVS